ncbi:peptidase S8/S53 domain-containing protein [Cubamyces menziesii]|nr:peptidase S8/S53 domain-containing protein [Cubamyces menziesii]
MNDYWPQRSFLCRGKRRLRRTTFRGLFLGKFRQDVGRRPAEVVLGAIDGSTGGFGSTGTLEASLDLQYTAGLATKVPIFVLSVGSQTSDGIDGFLDAINALLGQDPAPQVLTTSFGFNEQDLPAPIAINLCNAYAQLGARGTTVLFASGDGGVSGIQPTKDCTTFTPTFP